MPIQVNMTSSKCINFDLKIFQQRKIEKRNQCQCDAAMRQENVRIFFMFVYTEWK